MVLNYMNKMISPLLVGNLAVSGALMGLIWTVQLVAYPLYASVPESAFVAYHAAWSTRITLVVAPLMLAELVLGLGWVAQGGRGLALAALACTVAAWAVTWGLSVPAHEVLNAGFSREAWQRLLGTNWLRTAAWTLRTGLVAVALLRS